MDAGYSLVAAIRCATLNGAGLLSLPEKGELVIGRQATLVVLDGGPDSFPVNLARPAILISSGRVVSNQAA
jgi:imidazolonepropionase-like amidohydrolase